MKLIDLKKIFSLNVFVFWLALAETEDYPVYIVTVSNLRQAAQDQHGCDQAFHAIQNIVLESHRFAVDFVNENFLRGTGLKLQTLVIDSCYTTDWSQQQVDCIFLRAEPFGMIPNGMCQKRKLESSRTAGSEWKIPKGMLVAVMGPMSSNTAEQYANFMQTYCIPVLGSAPTSVRFDNLDRFKYFLRSVPSDKYQVKAIIYLLESVKLHRIAIIHESSNYGKDFNTEFEQQVMQLPIEGKICIVANIEVPNYSQNDWNSTLDKLEIADARIILLFLDFPQTMRFFDAAASRPNWLNGRFQFIGIDGWSNQQEFTENSKPLIVNSIASEPSSPIWQPFRDHIMGLTLTEALEKPKPDFCREIANYSPISDMIQTQNECNSTRACTGNETLKNVPEGTLIRASQAFDNVYIVGKTLADYCFDTNGSCKEKLALLTGKQFYEMMKSNEINLTDYYFKFLENSATPLYNFYQYQATTDGKYVWQRVGEYFNGSLQLQDNLIETIVGRSACQEDITATIISIAVSVAAVMIIIVLILIVVIIYKQHQTSKQSKQMDNLRRMLEMQTTRPSISFKSKQQQTYNAGFEIIPRDALQIAEVLGKGQFGEVKKAFLAENVIAVKELHEKNMDESSSFVKELLTMIQLGYHPNILRVFGAVTENLSAGKLMICMEYCEEGSLRQLIKRERDRYADERTDIDKYYTETISLDVWDKILEGKRNLGYNLATRDLLSYGYQITNGMCYLEEKGVVHRDLAARNVLCNQNGIVKISDYGLAETCPFVMKSAGKLPVHILAPECLQEKHIFSSCSDVWAFGVLLWDIFNLCREEPYKKWNVPDAETLLQSFSSGRRLDIPKYATKALHELMLGCWSFDPERRLGFVKCRNLIALEFERCAPGSVEELRKKLADEIATVMKDELNKLNTLMQQRHTTGASANALRQESGNVQNLETTIKFNDLNDDDTTTVNNPYYRNFAFDGSPELDSPFRNQKQVTFGDNSQRSGHSKHDDRINTPL